MTTHISCPYCNTSFSPDAVLPGGRLECPRCGETFALKGSVSPAEMNGVAPSRPATANRAERKSPAALFVAGLLLVLLGGSYLAYTYFQARKPQPPAEPPPAVVVRPVELAGLAYLPGDCNLVFGVQPVALLDYARRTDQDARQLLTQAGLPAGAFAFLDKAGIGLDQVDHVVGGTFIGDAVLELRIALVLVLRTAPEDEERFLQAFDAKRSQTGNGRFNVNLNLGFKVPLSMVRVSPTVWVFGWADADFGPAEKGSGGGLSPAMREKVGDDQLAGCGVWVAAGEGKWADKPLVKQLMEMSANKDALPALAKGRAAVGGLAFGEQPQLRLRVWASDQATAEKMRDAIRAKGVPAVNVSGAGGAVTVTVPFDPQSGLQPLRQVVEAIK
jgi:hypothetical protein